MSLTQRLRAQSTRGEEPRRRLLIREIAEPSAALEGADTIGAALRAARIARDLDIGTVARALRIRRQHIEALEENDLAELPPTAYALGFVRTYASYLHLDPDECLRRFKVELRAQTSQLDHQSFHFPEAKRESWLPQGSMLILAALLGIGVYSGWYVSVTADRAEADRVPPLPETLAEAAGKDVAVLSLPAVLEAPTAQSATIVPVDSPAEIDVDPEAVGGPFEVETASAAARAEAGAPDAASQAYAMAEEEGELDLGLLLPSTPDASDELGGDVPSLEEASAGRVILRARERTWVRIEDANSQILIQQELDSGEGYLVPNRAGLILSVRDAGAIEVYIDGVPLGLLGRPGEALPAVSLDPASLKVDHPS